MANQIQVKSNLTSGKPELFLSAAQQYIETVDAFLKTFHQQVSPRAFQNITQNANIAESNSTHTLGS